MVRDAGSAGAQRPAHAESAALGGNNLSQELAQLLAASVAKGPGARTQPGGIATGSDLASLASLVSAAAAKRGLAPTFKDGLSALSYAPPQPRQSGQVALSSDLHLHDDEPMPIPSTWRQPAQNDDERWFRQQLGAAVLGLVAGLMVVVPAVLWLSGRLGGTPSAKPVAGQSAPAATDTKAAEIKTVKVQVRPVEKPPEVASPFVTAAIEPRRTVEPQSPAAMLPPPRPAPVEIKPVEPPRPRFEETLSQAERRIKSGDVMGAREMLGALEGSGQGDVTFALAETYDPNMLAAWATRGVSADPAKARALYGKALSLGVGRAQMRLDALK